MGHRDEGGTGLVSGLLELVAHGGLVQGQSGGGAIREDPGNAHTCVLPVARHRLRDCQQCTQAVVGAPSSHQRGSRARANGASAVPRVEDLAGVGQFVDVRCAGCGMTSEAEVSVAEVINKKEKNIWRRRTGIASTAAQENGD